MPSEDQWGRFFDADRLVERLFGNRLCRGDVVEFGCGYGTFSIPAARRTTGVIHALDIEPEMVERVHVKAVEASLGNLRAGQRDFVADGTGLEPASQSHAMIYNLLHIEAPLGICREAHRVLRPGGVLSVIHWRSDIPTPRGPSLEIRPTPEQCKTWISTAGFRGIRDVDVQDCCPYHFGIIAVR